MPKIDVFFKNSLLNSDVFQQGDESVKLLAGGYCTPVR